MILIPRVLCIVLLTVASFSAVAESQKLRIVTEHWPPYNFLDEVGGLHGIATDKVRQILAKAGLNADIELLSWSKAYNLAISRPNTLIYSIIRSPEREQIFDWYCPIIEPIVVSLYKLRERDDIKLVDLQDAKKYSIAALRNDYAQQYLIAQGFVEGMNLQTTSNDTASLRLLKQGRIDLVVFVKAAMQFRMQQLELPIESVEIALPSIDGKKLMTCMALSKGSDKSIKAALDLAMLDLQP